MSRYVLGLDHFQHTLIIKDLVLVLIDLERQLFVYLILHGRTSLQLLNLARCHLQFILLKMRS